MSFGLPRDWSSSAALMLKRRQIADMHEAGTVGPAKVVRPARQDAASIMGLLHSTEGRITEAQKRAPAMPGGGAGGMSGMEFQGTWPWAILLLRRAEPVSYNTKGEHRYGLSSRRFTTATKALVRPIIRSR